MRAAFLRTAARHLRGPAAAGSADADLLARFAQDRDEAAYAELVRRHGPLVWGVCRRALANRADAEDAFQATFLVLARNPRAVRRQAAVGCWLYGVARRVAVRTRGRQPVVAADGGATVPDPQPPALDRLTAREFLAALDEELDRLPEKLRRPLVVCFLQERTQTEAAQALGLSLSTLKRRLEAGRDLLRDRLARRGVDLSAVLAATGLAAAAGTAPSAVVEATVRAAFGATMASASVVTITEGVLRAMGHTKLKAWAAGVLMITAAAGGTGYVAVAGGQTGGPGPGPVVADGARKPESAKDAADDVTKKPGTPKDATEGATADPKLLEIELKYTEVALAESQRAIAAYEEQRRALDVIAANVPKFERLALDITIAKLKSEAATLSLKLESARHRLAVVRGTIKVDATPAMTPELRTLYEEMLAAVREAARLDQMMIEASGPGMQFDDQTDLKLNNLRRSKQIYELESRLGDRVQAARNYLARTKSFETYMTKRAQAGRSRMQDALDAKAGRLEAEIWLKEAESAVSSNVQKAPTGPVAPALLATFRGAVQSYDAASGLVTLTPGSDGGIQIGTPLWVVRVTDGGKFLGTVRVVSVDAKTATGRFSAESAGKVGPGDAPRAGDELRGPKP